MDSNFNQTIRYLKQILRLSLPITVSFIAVGMMNLVDTIIVGNYQTNQLAYIGLAGGGLSSIILNGSRFVWLTLRDKRQ